MNRKLLFAFVAVIGLLSTEATAETTGNDLHTWLKSTDPSVNLRGYAYIDGVLDSEDFYLTNAIISSFLEKNPSASRFRVAHICFGDAKITFGQIKDIIQKYLENNPAKRHIRAHSLIRFALMESFACAKNPLPSPEQ